MSISFMLLSVLVFLATHTQGETYDEYMKRSAILREASEKAMSEIRNKKNVILMKSGLVIETFKNTTKKNAKSPTVNDECLVHLTGFVPNGTLIDPRAPTTIKVIPARMFYVRSFEISFIVRIHAPLVGLARRASVHG